jgi:ribose transport system substrate-binding protein
MKSKLDVVAPKSNRRTDKYWVPVVAKTIDLLDCFSSEAESLTLEEVVKRTKIPHTTAYRILHTLVCRNYLQQSGRLYRLNRLRKRLKVGFANLSMRISLAVEIQRSLEKASSAAGIDLMIWDNNRDADIAIKNAEEMAQSKVDLAIEFQLFEQVAPVIADIFSRAGIPLISIVNPHHGTLYFGVDNYRAGFCAGMALAEYASEHWRGRPDTLVLLESPRAGRTVQSRLIGVKKGVEERLGVLPEKAVHHLDGGGDRPTAKAALEDFLSRRACKRILIAGINDESAIGAAEAAAGKRDLEMAIVGHGGSPEILEIVADPQSACIGTVSFRPDLYGPGLVSFGLPILQGRSAPPVHYVRHEFLGKKSLARVAAQAAH